MRWGWWGASLATAALALPSTVQAVEWSGNVAGELRYYPTSPLDGRQQDGNLSLSFQPELYHEFEDRSFIVFSPFFRLDQHDHRRTHADIRELYWQKSFEQWDLRLGVRKVFWGKTESQHLVDIINQTDLIESFDGEEKLGQPMLNAAWIQDWGTIDFFVLPGFRERTLPGVEGRLRPPLPIDHDGAQYESALEEWHVDAAVRYSHYIGNWDFGISHFWGTSREPLFRPTLDDLQLKLAPQYDIIHQTGVDVQYTSGSWLLKFEGVRRSGQGDPLGAITTGFEYTFYQAFKTDADIGVLAEYLWDSRGDDAFAAILGESVSPFQNDLFLGTRIALNDIQSSSLLAGAIVDLESGALTLRLEAERRLGESWKLSVEANVLANVPADDPLTYFRKDDYVQVELAYYF